MGRPRKAPDIFLINQLYISCLILLDISGISTTDIQLSTNNSPRLYDSSSVVNIEQKCQPLDSPFCNIPSYLTVQPFNNTLGHTSLNDALAELHKYAYLLSKDPCKDKIQLFLCSLYAPVCVSANTWDSLLLPCRDDCEEAKRYCSDDLVLTKSNWPDEWDCRKFNYQSDDKLCVINNAKNESRTLALPPSQAIPQTPLLPLNIDDKRPLLSTDTLIPHDNDTLCADDFFDCKIRDPEKNMNALCIDRRWVCDGKKDCIIEGLSPEGLDEDGCEQHCADGLLFCDGKCIPKSSLCNGKVDCSSGFDEQECYDYLTGLIQSILCIFALFSAIYLLVRFFRIDDEENKVEYAPPPVYQQEQVPQPQLQPPHYQATVHLHHHHLHHHEPEPDNDVKEYVINQRCPELIYQELTYSNKSDYERLNIGGYSGASSVYAYSYHQPLNQTYQLNNTTPAPPPPTPNQTNPPTPVPYKEGMELYSEKGLLD